MKTVVKTVTVLVMLLTIIFLIVYVKSTKDFDRHKAALIEETAFLSKSEEEVKLPVIEVSVVMPNEEQKEDYQNYEKDVLIDVLAKTIYGEARDLSKTEKAAVCWCAFNIAEERYKNPSYIDVVSSTTKKHTFYGYKYENPATDENKEIAKDVIERWEMEKCTTTDVGRVLPKEYRYFVGDGHHNHFRNNFEEPYDIWDWSLDSPYEEDWEK